MTRSAYPPISHSASQSKDITFSFNGEKVLVVNGKDGVDGQNGSNGKDGVDGLDGNDGIDGQDGVNGKDGITPVFGVDYFNGKDGNSITALQIVTKINSLKGKINISAIKGLQDIIDSLYISNAGGLVSVSAGGGGERLHAQRQGAAPRKSCSWRLGLAVYGRCMHRPYKPQRPQHALAASQDHQ